MSTQESSNLPGSVPAAPASPTGTGVRRHHTISASSRTARGAARDTISEESSQSAELWDQDGVVEDDWVGGVGAVGEKSGLHRQTSLPTRYHRAQAIPPSGTRSGTRTPNRMNSLQAIAGHEENEQEWEKEIGGYSAGEDQLVSEQQAANSPLSPYNSSGAGIMPGPSPPPAASGVRRHVSLTYGAQTGPRKVVTGANLKRSGTLQHPLPNHSQQDSNVSESSAEGQEEYEYEYNVEDPGAYDDEYYQQAYGGVGGVDDVQRALGALDINNNNQQGQGMQPMYGTGALGGISYTGPGGQSAHPPRFNPQHPPGQSPGMRPPGMDDPNAAYGQQKLQLVTDFDGRKTPLGSGSPYMQHAQPTGYNNPAQGPRGQVLQGRTSNPNLQYGYQQQQGGGHSRTPSGNPVPAVPPIPQQYYVVPGQPIPRGPPPPSGQSPAPGFTSTPVDVPSLIAAKGYNPSTFDLRPQNARYFVIKSYTEDDVHKSLKYEIWSSTDPGNKRLDKAFKENNGRGPIYLFFSVNASGHFCGMAEMTTPVDYTRSSTVWASDKWKGVFKVRWIFVRDIPNANLRHIKLNNTQERKPVTNSRDTQELLPEAGQEMLKIFFTHPARTSLLQDFAFYELQAAQKMAQAQAAAAQGNSNNSSPTASNAGGPPGQGGNSPMLANQQFNPAGSLNAGIPAGNGGAGGLANPNALAYQMPMMSPMVQMGLQMNLDHGVGRQGGGYPGPAGQVRQGPGGNGAGQMGVSQGLQSSVMRNPSPAPAGAAGAGGNGGNGGKW